MQTQKAFDYPRYLGQTIGNLHSLEILLRLFLHNVDSKRYGSPPPKVDLVTIKIGDAVAENYFTNYDSLGELVRKYNNFVTSRQAPEFCVDETVVKLRDAIAHGRVLGKEPAPPFQLYKFGKPSEGRLVRVEDVADFNEDELTRYINRSFSQIKKVEEACKQFCPSALG